MSNRNKKLLKPIEIYLPIISDLDTNCLTVEMINQKIAAKCLDNLILNTINTIRKKDKKRPRASSVYEFICIIENKCTNGSTFKAPVLLSATDESVTLSVNRETPSVKNGAI